MLLSSHKRESLDELELKLLGKLPVSLLPESFKLCHVFMVPRLAGSDPDMLPPVTSSPCKLDISPSDDGRVP